MTDALLDRPIWHSLTTRHAGFAIGEGAARRFDPRTSPFAAARDDAPESLADLAPLIPEGDSVFLMQAGETPPPSGLAIAMVAPGVQMVLETLIAPRPADATIERLSDTDAPEMLALATLTQPGPFRDRTHRLGAFWGVREGGRLIAMAGERLRLEGFTEISAVCTHPDARGRGLAGALSHHVATGILARGETPFLHAWAGNTNAIRLYETLGFRLRRGVVVTELRRA